MGFIEAWYKRLTIQNRTRESALVCLNSVAPHNINIAPHIWFMSQAAQALESSCSDPTDPLPDTLQSVQYQSRPRGILRRLGVVLAGRPPPFLGGNTAIRKFDDSENISSSSSPGRILALQRFANEAEGLLPIHQNSGRNS